MKLRKSELCAIVLTALFLCVSLGWQMGLRQRVPDFTVGPAVTSVPVSRVLPAAETAPVPAASAPPVREMALPAPSEAPSAPAEDAVPETPPEAATPAPAPPASPVDLNTAGAEELKSLYGIGDALAERIIADRAENGPYLRVEDVLRVKGIGPKFLENNLDRLTVGGSEGA